MSVTIRLEAKAKPGQAEKLRTILSTTVIDTRAYDGCQSISIHERYDEEGSFLFHQQWESKDKYEKYFAWRAASEDMKKITPLLAFPPKVSVYRNLHI